MTSPVLWFKFIGSIFSAYDVESSCLELLRKSPDEVLVHEALARLYWERGEYALSNKHAVHALRCKSVGAEMHLFAAVSAYHLSDLESAHEHACAAMQVPRPNIRGSNATESIVFKIFERLPFFRSRLKVLRSELTTQDDHYDKLYAWVRDFAETNLQEAGGTTAE